jgi:hypothetical protein
MKNTSLLNEKTAQLAAAQDNYAQMSASMLSTGLDEANVNAILAPLRATMERIQAEIAAIGTPADAALAKLHEEVKTYAEKLLSLIPICKIETDFTVKMVFNAKDGKFSVTSQTYASKERGGIRATSDGNTCFVYVPAWGEFRKFESGSQAVEQLRKDGLTDHVVGQNSAWRALGTIEKSSQPKMKFIRKGKYEKLVEECGGELDMEAIDLDKIINDYGS